MRFRGSGVGHVVPVDIKEPGPNIEDDLYAAMDDDSEASGMAVRPEETENDSRSDCESDGADEDEDDPVEEDEDNGGEEDEANTSSDGDEEEEEEGHDPDVDTVTELMNDVLGYSSL